MGYSSRHGSHQVAQKVTSSGLPWYLATIRLYAAPSMSIGSAIATAFAGLLDALPLLCARTGAIRAVQQMQAVNAIANGQQRKNRRKV